DACPGGGACSESTVGLNTMSKMKSGRFEIAHNEEVDACIGDKILQPKESFRYLGSMIHKSRRIDEDVSHRIKTSWLKWRAATGVLYDRSVPLKLKGKFYRVAIRPSMLYGSECWTITKSPANRVEVARWTCGRTMIDMIPNEVYKAELEVENIINKMREGRLRWFGHVRRRPRSTPIRQLKEKGLVVVCRVVLVFWFSLSALLFRPLLASFSLSSLSCFCFLLCFALWSFLCYVLVFLCFVALCAPLAPMLLYAFLSLSFACSCSCLLVFAFLRFRGPMLVSDLIVCVASPSGGLLGSTLPTGGFPKGRGMTVYISPPSYPALAGLGIVVVVVVMEAWGIRKLLNTVEDQTPDDLDVTNMLSSLTLSEPASTFCTLESSFASCGKLDYSSFNIGLKQILSENDISTRILRSTYPEAVEMMESQEHHKRKGKRKSSNGFTVKQRQIDYIDLWQGPTQGDSSLRSDGCPKFSYDVMGSSTVIKEGLLSSVKTTAQYVFTKRVILEVRGAQFAMVGFRWSMDDPGFLDIVEGLAKHLRCVGIDAAVPYSKKPETRELIDQAIKEKRVLLTRDAKLLRHEYLLKNQIYRVKSLLKNDQLNEVLASL
ncbi:ataxia telangiectasia mutated family protein, partial [Tanacetum coccineum]